MAKTPPVKKTIATIVFAFTMMAMMLIMHSFAIMMPAMTMTCEQGGGDHQDRFGSMVLVFATAW